MTIPGDPQQAPPDRAPARPVWLVWLIPMAALVGLIWFVLRGDRSPETQTGEPVVAAEQPAAQ